MEHLATLIYIGSILDSINLFLIALITITLIINIVLTIINLEEKTFYKNKFKVIFSYVVLLCIIIITILIPTKNTFYTMIIVPKIASVENVEVIKKEFGDIYSIAKKNLLENITNEKDNDK